MRRSPRRSRYLCADVRRLRPRRRRALLAFVSQASFASGAVASYDLTKMPVPVRNCRNIRKKDMRLNDATPKIEVDPENIAFPLMASTSPANRPRRFPSRNGIRCFKAIRI